MTEEKITSEAAINELFDTLLTLEDREDLRLLFEDLCTAKEVEQMAMRLAAARLLNGGCTYNEVMARVDISSATLSRVSRCVQYGKGYKRFALPEEG